MTKTFQQMLLAHLPKLRAYALMLTRNRPDADDLVQTVAILTLRAESQFIAGTNFSAWTYRILKNSYISTCRGHKRRPSALDDVPEAALAYPSRQYDQVLAAEITRATDQLSEKLREVLMLICGGEMSYEDAAQALSCSVGTVKSRLWRAREQMKVLLDGVHDSATEQPSEEFTVAAVPAGFLHPLRGTVPQLKVLPVLTEALTFERQVKSDVVARNVMAEANSKRRAVTFA